MSQERMPLEEFIRFWMSRNASAGEIPDDYMSPEEWQETYDGSGLAGDDETPEEIVATYSSPSYIMQLFKGGVEHARDGNGGPHPVCWHVLEESDFAMGAPVSFTAQQGDVCAEITLGNGYTFEVIVRAINGPTAV